MDSSIPGRCKPEDLPMIDEDFCRMSCVKAEFLRGCENGAKTTALGGVVVLRYHFFSVKIIDYF